MGILHTTKTKLTYDEYLRMSKFSRRKSRRFSIIFVVFMLLFALLGFAFGIVESSAFLVILSGIIIGTECYQTYGIPKKYFNSYKGIDKGEITIHFYENKIEQINHNGSVVLEYDDIYKIYETKTNFYILQSVREVIIVVKENCSEELCEFIRSKK